MNILVLGSETPAGKIAVQLAGSIGIESKYFSTRRAKVSQPMDVIINCQSIDEPDNMDNMYGVNVTGNERMMKYAKLFDAHYIRISTHRVRSCGDCYEDTKLCGDGTPYGNTMALSEHHVTYQRSTVIRGDIDIKTIEKIIDRKIYGIVNIQGEIVEGLDTWKLYTNNPLLCI